MKSLAWKGALLFAAWVSVAGLASAQVAQAKGQRAADSSKRIARVVSYEQLGKAIADEAVIAAAKQLRDRQRIGDSVLVTLRFTFRQGDLPDACFEECMEGGRSTALQCHLRCEVPVPDRGVGPITPPANEHCVELRWAVSKQTGEPLFLCYIPYRTAAQGREP